MNPFSLLRTWAKNSVIGGIQDAVDELGTQAGPSITVKVELAAITAPTPAPAIDDDRPTGRKRKADATA